LGNHFSIKKHSNVFLLKNESFEKRKSTISARIGIRATDSAEHELNLSSGFQVLNQKRFKREKTENLKTG